ncbi:MAG: hypothetical protein D6767_03710 [Candidatus Hydrogenedentota bacterium]|nr:MAG: hypothetical protein D6767_03710 [Candidatus Hydrogenedentota bacterium]
MNPEYQKRMQNFLQKLWSNPNLSSLPLDKKENQVLIFLRDNRPRLQQVFAQPDYFPGVPWEEVLRSFLNEMLNKMEEVAKPLILQAVEKALSVDITHYFLQKSTIDKEKLIDLLLHNLKDKGFRAQLLPVLNLILYGYFDKYIPEAMERRKYIFNELVRHDRLNLTTEDMVYYLNLASLFRPFNYMPVTTPSGKKVIRARNITDVKAKEESTNLVKAEIRGHLGPVPETILEAGLQSIEAKDENPDISGSAKLIGIMVLRMNDFNPNIKQDRGAESADKSWFHITRRNAKVYGLDPDLLDELYQIASERGW